MPDLEPYTPQEREIFRYFDGKKWRWADPLTVRRRLAMALVPNTLEKTIELCKHEDEPIRNDFREKLIFASRHAFEMPWNADAEKEEDAGASENQVLDAINAFIAFNKKKALNIEKNATLPAVSDSIPSESAGSPSRCTTAGS